VKRFRRGLVFKARGLLYHSTFKPRVIKRKKKTPICKHQHTRVQVRVWDLGCRIQVLRHSFGGDACMATVLEVIQVSFPLHLSPSPSPSLCLCLSRPLSLPSFLCLYMGHVPDGRPAMLRQEPPTRLTTNVCDSGNPSGT
jgi:hypothetical protein